MANLSGKIAYTLVVIAVAAGLFVPHRLLVPLLLLVIVNGVLLLALLAKNINYSGEVKSNYFGTVTGVLLGFVSFCMVNIACFVKIYASEYFADIEKFLIQDFSLTYFALFNLSFSLAMGYQCFVTHKPAILSEFLIVKQNAVTKFIYYFVLGVTQSARIGFVLVFISMLIVTVSKSVFILDNKMMISMGFMLLFVSCRKFISKFISIMWRHKFSMGSILSLCATIMLLLSLAMMATFSLLDDLQFEQKLRFDFDLNKLKLLTMGFIITSGFEFSYIIAKFSKGLSMKKIISTNITVLFTINLMLLKIPLHYFAMEKVAIVFGFIYLYALYHNVYSKQAWTFAGLPIAKEFKCRSINFYLQRTIPTCFLFAGTAIIFDWYAWLAILMLIQLCLLPIGVISAAKLLFVADSKPYLKKV